MNNFGHLLRVTTFGESHGPAIGCVVDGCPPGIAIAPADFAHDLKRRATGNSRHVSQRHEADEVEILSGVYQGLTTGAPVALLIRNTDQRSKDYDAIARQFRPGHADYTYWQKYGTRDPRGGGRSSARETTMRVAAGVIAKKWLADRHGVRVRGWLSQLGDIVPGGFDAGGAVERFRGGVHFADDLGELADHVGHGLLEPAGFVLGVDLDLHHQITLRQFVGDRIGIDRHWRRAQHLRGAQAPVEQRTVGADDGDLVAFGDAELAQAKRDCANLVVDFQPRPRLPDAAILVAERRTSATHARVHAQQLRKRVLRRIAAGRLLACSHSPLPSRAIEGACFRPDGIRSIRRRNIRNAHG